MVVESEAKLSNTGPMYKSIYEKIRTDILSGTLTPGARLDTEAEMAKRYQVSVGTIRQAQNLLIREGLMYKKQKRGAFVSPGAEIQKKILLVFGLDVINEDVSPAYFLRARLLTRECAPRGFTLETAWLNSSRPADAEAYCNPGSARQYLGYIFVGCEKTHRLLHYVASHGLNYVFETYESIGHRRITTDHAGAFKGALDLLIQRGHRHITLVGFPGLESRYTSIMKKTADANIRLIEFDISRQGMSVIEKGSYCQTVELLTRNAIDDAIIFTDDIIARGATRALLQFGSGHPFDLVVFASRQAVIPLGLPVTYVVTDTQEEVRQAMRILVNQIEGRLDEPDYFVGKYKIFTEPVDSVVQERAKVTNLESGNLSDFEKSEAKKRD